MMRAWSAKQRFPVAKWIDQLEKLQDGVIHVHDKNQKKATKKASALLKKSVIHGNMSTDALNPDIELTDRSPSWLKPTIAYDDESTTLGGPSMPASAINTPLSSRPTTPTFEFSNNSLPGTPRGRSPAFADFMNGHHRFDSDASAYTDNATLGPPGHSRVDSSASWMSASANNSMTPPSGFFTHANSSRASMLSLDEVVGERKDFKLQQVDPFFTDSDGEFYNAFEKRLGDLNASNSISDLCIEDFLMKSEKQWFNMYRDVKLGRGRARSSSPSSRAQSRSRSRNRLSKLPPAGLSVAQHHHDRRPSGLMHSTRPSLEDEPDVEHYKEQFDIGDDYVPPTGLKKYLQYRVGEWPVYAILLAIGQVIASNSYQITLLTGSVGEAASKLYATAGVYLVFTIVWYIMSRTLKLFHPLSLPFFVYGVAFLVLGVSPFASNTVARAWLQNVATGIYAAAASSGGLAFAFNFGTDGGSPVSTWIARLAAIQGASQLYSLGLWAWGSAITAASASNESIPSLASSPAMLGVCLPICILLWVVGAVLFVGLPDFYRETPGPVPQLWLTLLRRKTIAWYLLAVVLQNYFLSTLYGRTWLFLFSSDYLPTWAVVLLALAFFVVCWCAVLCALARLAKSHPWLFPMFAVGLGAPRWAQTWWACSRIGLWLPWAGSAAAGAAASRMLWLWLGLLDGLQGAGVGMMLMLTLTRVHVAAAVVAAQVIGSIFTILGRATAPDKLGPGDVFPDLSAGVSTAMSKAWFWVVLLLQVGICFGYFKFFRKEQVSKP
jgi:alpha-1,3-glucan synthase